MVLVIETYIHSPLKYFCGVGEDIVWNKNQALTFWEQACVQQSVVYLSTSCNFR